MDEQFSLEWASPNSPPLLMLLLLLPSDCLAVLWKVVDGTLEFARGLCRPPLPPFGLFRRLYTWFGDISERCLFKLRGDSKLPFRLDKASRFTRLCCGGGIGELLLLFPPPNSEWRKLGNVMWMWKISCNLKHWHNFSQIVFSACYWKCFVELCLILFCTKKKEGKRFRIPHANPSDKSQIKKIIWGKYLKASLKNIGTLEC